MGAGEPREPTDEELAALASRIRRHRRRALLAKVCGVGVAFVLSSFGLVIGWFLVRGREGGRLFLAFGMVGVAAGAFVYKLLDPPGDPSDE